MLKPFRNPSTALVLTLYACLSVAWILVGDYLEGRVVGGAAEAWGWQTAKGLVFVGLSALVLAWFGTQRDRAEARQREQERRLHERHHLYLAMFDQSPALKLLIDPENCAVIDANPAAADYYGYTREQLRNSDLSRLWALGLAECRELLARATQSGASVEQEHRMADGSLREVACSAEPLVLDDREVVYMLVQDMSEQRRAELELRVRSTALEAAHNGVVLTDSRGVIEWVNPAFTAMTGYTAEEATGSTPQELSANLEGNEFYRQLWRTLEAGLPWQGELRVSRKDGSTYTEEQSITPVRDEAGRIRHYIAIKHDVSEKRSVREALERRAQQQAALAELGQSALSEDDPAGLMERAIDVVADVLAVDCGNILFLAPGTDTFVMQAGVGWREGVVGRLEVARDSATMAGYVVACGSPVISPDVRNETRFPPPPLLLEHGITSSLAVPIDYGQETFGILGAHSVAARAFDATDVAFLQGVANVLAAAIRQRRYAEALRESNRQLLGAYDATIEGWAQALDLKDHETEGHSRRVTDLSVALGRVLGFSEAELVNLRRGALLHDIGKMGVPDAVLHKPGPLTDEEWAIMRTHPTLAREMLKSIGFLGDAIEVPYGHHERWDGSGYPQGLKGERIPLSARVFAVVDVYDALTSERPYRKAWEPAKALAYIRQEAGRQFDPAVVKAFTSLVTGGDAATE